MTYSFADFVAKFPPVNMPITLGEDTHHTFGTENDPLPEAMIEQYIVPLETKTPDDEFTEYVPCFSFNDTKTFVALVWWKAELLNYEYVLSTYTLKGQLISSHVIAQTKIGAKGVYHAVTTINEDYEIMVASGVSPDGNTGFEPGSSKMSHLEILANGQVIEV